MILATLARCRSFAQTFQRGCEREISRRTRGTLIALVGFGGFLMLMGGLFTYSSAYLAFEQLRRGGFGIVRSGAVGKAAAFLSVLLWIFVGNFVRSVSWLALQRGQISAAAPRPATGAWGPRTITAGIVAVLIAPAMLLWGAVGLVSCFHWFDSYFLGRPVTSWLGIARFFGVGPFLNVCAWWFFTLASLAGGVLSLWLGTRALFQRPAETTSAL